MQPGDIHYMQQAINEAKKALAEDEVPIGALIVMQDKIIARAFNQVEKLNDSTAHAEILALTSAYNYLGSKYLPEATLYVTIEPCLMCAGALYWSKIKKIVYGANDKKYGALTLLRLPGEIGKLLHPKTEILSAVCEDECGTLIKDFFKARR